MTVETFSNIETSEGLVQDMRKIRDEISLEIKEMSFEEERAYLDKLLNRNKEGASIKRIAAKLNA